MLVGKKRAGRGPARKSARNAYDFFGRISTLVATFLLPSVEAFTDTSSPTFRLDIAGSVVVPCVDEPITRVAEFQ